MPNRFIRESICTSDNIDSLTEFQEIFFYRLIVNCDDFGRFDGRAKLLSSRLFPLRSVTEEKVEETLAALENADLIFVYYVRRRPYLQVKTWDKYQQRRATESKYPAPENADDISPAESNDNNCNQMISDDINCNQEITDDSKCHRIRIRNTYSNNDIRIRQSRAEDNDDDQMIADDSARQIQSDQDQVLDAAENAGFQKTDAVRSKLIHLFADHGKQKMLDGIDSCVTHGAPNIAYLTAVLKGEPKARTPTKGYVNQRDYSGEQADAMRRMIEQYGGAAK